MPSIARITQPAAAEAKVKKEPETQVKTEEVVNVSESGQDEPRKRRGRPRKQDAS